MQFFPPVQPGPVQTAQFGGMTESLETKAGQDFEFLLSEHLDQADTGSDSRSAGPSEVRTEAVPVASAPPSEMERGEARQEEVRADEHGSVPEKQRPEQIKADETNAAQAAKPAAGEKEQVHVDEGDVPTAVSLEEAVVDEAAIADEAEELLTELAGEVDGLLAELAGKAEGLASELGTLLSGAAEIKGEGHAQTRGKMEVLAARMQAMQAMLQQFRQSDPAGRAELAESLGAQLRTLRDDVAAFERTSTLDASLSRQAVNVSFGKISSILTRIEAAARRIETSGSSPQTGQAASATVHRAASSKVQSSGATSVPETAVQTKISRHGGSPQRDSGVAVQAPSTSLAHTGDTVSSKIQPRQDSATSTQPSQSQAPQSRPAKVQSVQSSSESTVRVQALSQEESEAVSGRQPVSAASNQETTAGESKAVQQAQARSTVAAAAAGAETVQAASTKPVAKDLSVPVGKRDSGLENKTGTETTASLEPAETKAGGGRQEPRPEFFAAPDREKTPASKTATSGAGAKIVAEAESATQTTTSTLQTPTQSRLEAPVNARTSEVYRQVENGAFKNLGQGLKQLVIRLDPADLGQVSVILQVRGKEVQAVLRASSQETSQALSEQMGQLRTQLEAQGLKVSRLEVQTQLSDSQTQSQWEGAEQHNRFQENRELAFSALRWRTLGQVDSSLARDMQNIPQKENISSSGLDIFA